MMIKYARVCNSMLIHTSIATLTVIREIQTSSDKAYNSTDRKQGRIQSGKRVIKVMGTVRLADSEEIQHVARIYPIWMNNLIQNCWSLTRADNIDLTLNNAGRRIYLDKAPLEQNWTKAVSMVHPIILLWLGKNTSRKLEERRSSKMLTGIKL